MKCNEYKAKIGNLIEYQQFEISTEITEHISTCDDCLDYLMNTKKLTSMLKPRIKPGAPKDLKTSIINKLKQERSIMKTVDEFSKSKIQWKKVSGIAAIILAVVIAIPIIYSSNGELKANNLLTSSIQAMKSIKSMVIKMKVRTMPNENFSFIGTEYEQVDHQIYKSQSPNRWRIEKEGRVALFDGKTSFLWVPSAEIAYKSDIKANFMEWFNIFLEPEKILQKEQEASKLKGSKVKLNEKGSEIHFTIESKAEGNFINDYCKNTSIAESDNRREYIFDKETKLLKGLKVFVKSGDDEVLVAEIESIEYDNAISVEKFQISLPDGQSWNNLQIEAKGENFKGISSKQAAELYFGAIAKENWDLAAEAMDILTFKTEQAKQFKEYYSGLQIVKIGESFKSGIYAGEFVPYEIKLKDGKTIKGKLALRNDNKNKVWQVDGGY